MNKLKSLWRPWFLYAGIFSISFFIFVLIQSASSFGDPDAYYHIKITKVLLTKGIIKTLPNLQYTFLKDSFTDHHFLYHFLLIPFLTLFGDFLGMLIATVFFASLFMVVFAWFLRSLEVRHPLLYTFLLLLVPIFIFRLNLAKASSLSLIILILGVYCILRYRYKSLIAISFLYVWVYGGFPLMLIMGVLFVVGQGVYFVVKNSENIAKQKIIYIPAFRYFFIPFKQRNNIKMIGAICLGLIAGLVINPYFPGNLYFYWLQIVKIGAVNYAGYLRVGSEWYPYNILDFILNNVFLSMVISIVLVVFMVNHKKMKEQNWFWFFVFCFFLLLTLKSKRYAEYFVPFSVVFFAVTIRTALGKKDLMEVLDYYYKRYYKNFFGHVFIIIFYFSVLIIGGFQLFEVHKGMLTYPIDDFKNAGNWISDNVPENSLIFQSDWDLFPMLYYYSDKHNYIVGLDPTFMYEFSETKYRLWDNLIMGYEEDQIYESIKNIFGSDYVIVDIAEQKKFDDNLQKDSRFNLVFEELNVRIYKLL